MSRSTSGSDLMRRAIAGDRAALSALLLDHYDSLHHHISNRISNQLQGLVRADDILQQTFVRAAQRITEFQPQHEGAFRGWLKTIAENLLRDAEKRRRRERRASSQRGRSTASEGNQPAGGLDQLAANLTTPARRVHRNDSIVRMKAAMQQLPREQREVIRRRYLLGQSLEEVAEALGCSKDAARGLCYRARQRLRAHMGRTSMYFSG
jgi:RNA polymerase sigma-70 factor (ECF subfamily)